jgi:hypothetical protein
LASPVNVYVPAALAVVVAVAFPVSVTVAPLPPAVTLIPPEMLKVAAAAALKLMFWLAPLIVSVVLDGVNVKPA